MPIKLETITTLNANDRRDLIEIYQNYPPTIDSKGQSTPSDWIESKLSEGSLILAGRFNGRLLGAAWGTQTNQQLIIDHLVVIAISRRRGVARQLLTLLTQQASQANNTLIIDEVTTPDTL